MDVRIEEIRVEKAGPLSDVHLKLGQFNLVYGLNEQGKTFLVEFVVGSLFNNVSEWSLRSTDARGQVTVAGLANQEQRLSPTSKKKLEDYLEESNSGLPTRISRLLVVKGAELGFEGARSPGVSRLILQDYLSGQGLLDHIRDAIQPTVRDSRIDDKEIAGARRGEIKVRSDAKDGWHKIDKLLNEVAEVYSGGQRQSLQEEIDQLQSRLDDQSAAKRHYAFKLDEQIREVKEQMDELPEDQLHTLRTNLDRLRDLNGRLERARQELVVQSQASRHYEWLDEAISLYEQRGAQDRNDQGRIYPIVILAALLMAIVSSLFDSMVSTAATILFILVAAAMAILYWRLQRSVLESAVNSDEITKLKTEYEKRLGEPFTGLPRMRELKSTMEKAHYGVKNLQERIDEEDTESRQLQTEIRVTLEILTSEATEPETWEQQARDLRERRRQLASQLEDRKYDLVALQVPEEEYQQQPTEVAYSAELAQELAGKLEAYKNDLRDAEEQMNSLKQRISQETGDDISLEWNTLIHRLEEKRRETAQEYREVTARILAGILVAGVVEELRAQEDGKIRERLSSPVVGEPIKRITGRYSAAHYEDDTIWVEDDFGRFKLDDLSTGAREQVLLGLRLGFAAQVFGRDRLFLLLDDAFQHADWTRRERLVNQMVALAKDGWQVTYFTMDDHIRDLFDAAGAEHFDGQYQSHELAA